MALNPPENVDEEYKRNSQCPHEALCRVCADAVRKHLNEAQQEPYLLPFDILMMNGISVFTKVCS